MADPLLPGVRLGIVRSISYGLFGKPDQFVPQLRELGVGLVRVYFYWSQVEPEPGRWSFDAVDAFLDQLDGSEEVWVTVCSSSPWATRRPPSPSTPAPAGPRRRLGVSVGYWGHGSSGDAAGGADAGQAGR